MDEMTKTKDITQVSSGNILFTHFIENDNYVMGYREIVSSSGIVRSGRYISMTASRIATTRNGLEFANLLEQFAKDIKNNIKKGGETNGK